MRYFDGMCLISKETSSLRRLMEGLQEDITQGKNGAKDFAHQIVVAYVA